MRIALYAVGGGRGHGLRASGLAQALRRAGARPRLVLPHARPTDDLDASLPTHRLPPVADRRAARAAVQALLDAHAFDGWVSDVFPEGPAGELAGLTLPPAVLVGRAHRAGHDPDFVRAAARHRLVLDTEPHLAWFGGTAASVGPLLRAPMIAADAPSVEVLVIADDPPLVALASRLRGRAAVAAGGVLRIGATRAPSHPRLLDRVRPRVLVGPAGYHLSYEARAAGIPHLALPRPRRFDLQAARADVVAIRVRSPRELAYQLERAPPRPPPLPLGSFDDAAARVLRALTSADDA